MVREVARCFTGWTIDYREEEETDGDGMLDGRRVLENLARHPSCARFISTKLCRRFVADVPPAAP